MFQLSSPILKPFSQIDSGRSIAAGMSQSWEERQFAWIHLGLVKSWRVMGKALHRIWNSQLDTAARVRHHLRQCWSMTLKCLDHPILTRYTGRWDRLVLIYCSSLVTHRLNSQLSLLNSWWRQIHGYIFGQHFLAHDKACDMLTIFKILSSLLIADQVWIWLVA